MYVSDGLGGDYGVPGGGSGGPGGDSGGPEGLIRFASGALGALLGWVLALLPPQTP